MMNIFLYGFSKCGKTYYGLRVAQMLHMNFIDSDLLVEEIYNQIHHQTLPYREIVKKHGFPFFCELEKHAVSRLSHLHNSIVSLGGGVLLDPENVERLKSMGVLIFIKAPKKDLERKVLHSEIPEYLLNEKNPSKTFDTLYKQRLPIYENIAQHVIHTEKLSEEQVLDQIVCLVRFCQKPK